MSRQTALSGLSANALPRTNRNRRLLGAFYTPDSAAKWMADWVVRSCDELVLEPSFGDGTFLAAVRDVAIKRQLEIPRVLGVEIDEAALKGAVGAELLSAAEARLGDFLSLEPMRVQAVIGNPPYVRLRHLSPDQRARALTASEAVLGHPMDPSGSLWMPFILHSLRFLEDGGRLAFVLPYDFTYVRYARPLWHALSSQFGSLRLLRTHQRLFPELLQDVVILLADDFGGRTSEVRFEAYERLENLLLGQPVIEEDILVSAIENGERPFLEALLNPELRHLLRGRVAQVTVPTRDLVTFNIGYVSGDRKFFHPEGKTVDSYQLPQRSLVPALTSARQLKTAGLFTSCLSKPAASQLFLPDPANLTAGEIRYIEQGVSSGVASGYKCRIRDPWFVVPGIRVPDVMLSVFSERPNLIVNDAGLLASNSLLCGYTRGPSGDELATSWYTSLTLLQCEIEVHALGGGVMVLVPRETGNIRLPKQVQATPSHLLNLDRLLKRGATVGAYTAGDQPILVEQVGLDPGDVEKIRQGVNDLAHWRTSLRTSTVSTSEPDLTSVSPAG